MTHNETNDLQIGDTVIVRGGFGSEAPEAVVIEGFGEKDGRELFDYTDHKGEQRWAYLTQITRKASPALLAS